MHLAVFMTNRQAQRACQISPGLGSASLWMGEGLFSMEQIISVKILSLSTTAAGDERC
jgi:uncharacterized membrane protein